MNTFVYDIQLFVERNKYNAVYSLLSMSKEIRLVLCHAAQFEENTRNYDCFILGVPSITRRSNLSPRTKPAVPAAIPATQRRNDVTQYGARVGSAQHHAPESGAQLHKITARDRYQCQASIGCFQVFLTVRAI